MTAEAAVSRAGERVQKVLARSGVVSRRKAEELIRAGRVTVNGRVCELGERVDLASDWIKLDGKTVSRPRPARYLLLHKPRGYVTTLSDPEGRRTVLDLVPPHLRRALFPVGRLDFDTEGLLLLTTDGDFAERLSHPRFGCRKRYEVKVRGTPTAVALDRLRRGLVLRGRKTAPCTIRAHRAARGRRPSTANTWWLVELGEGRSRQIREMFQRIGHPVQRLRRVAIGPLSLRSLPVGALRELAAEEVSRLRAAVGDRAARAPARSVDTGAC